LQVDEQEVAVRELLRGGFEPFAVEAERGDAQVRVDFVGGEDHVVLLVAAHPVLRAEEGSQARPDRGEPLGERGRGMGERRKRCSRSRHRGGVGQQHHPPPRKALRPFGFGDETVEAGAHHRVNAPARAPMHRALQSAA
jgi:hypothetical protein